MLVPVQRPSVGRPAGRRNPSSACCRCWREARAMTKRSFFASACLFLLLGAFAEAQTVIRVGAFPNITHPQAMVGKNNGWFEKAMGPQVKIEWKSFNAGPSAIEALFAGAIDMTYIGPNPAISGYVRSNGEALRIVAGATSGGAALVVRSDSRIQKPEDFHGLGGIHQRSAQRIVSRRHAPESFIQNGVRQRFSRFFRDLPVEKFFCLRQV